jgi:salicylate hydroxylase
VCSGIKRQEVVFRGFAGGLSGLESRGNYQVGNSLPVGKNLQAHVPALKSELPLRLIAVQGTVAAMTAIAASAASSPLKVVIIGAGPAGLCAATALKQDGHDVTVLERRRDIQPRGHALVIQPAAVRALKHLRGAHEAFDRVSVEASELRWWSYKAARPFAVPLPFVKELATEKRFQTDRPSVQKVLHQLAIANGARLLFGRAVHEVEDDAGKARLRTSSGEQFTADLIVAADGMPGSLP